MVPNDRITDSLPATSRVAKNQQTTPVSEIRPAYQSPEVFPVGSTVELLQGAGAYYGDFFGRFKY